MAYPANAGATGFGMSSSPVACLAAWVPGEKKDPML